jgi:hypothetical protein
MVELNKIRNSARPGKTLQAAIIAAFSTASGEAVSDSLGRFGSRDWRRLGTWLHASGLALYFLEAIRVRGLFGVVPVSVVEGLQQNQLDNRERTDSLIVEFIRLNTAFRSEGLDYLNVKGFSLGSSYCANPVLRSQFDLDFWMANDAAAECKILMNRLGYRLVGVTPSTLEFRSGEPAYPKFRDFYKARRQHSVEIHLRSSDEMCALPRENGLLNTFVFPTLSREQTFIQQAAHLTKHLLSEWTRASWMLELGNVIQERHNDATFWQNVRGQCPSEANRDAIGIAVHAAAEVFSFAVPSELSDWTVDRLPGNVVRWINEHAVRAVTAQFPGSKLYLLLERELATDVEVYRRRRRSVLLPMRLPGSFAAPTGPRGRMQASVSQARFFGVRLAFHVREGLRLLRAERDWIKQADSSNGCGVREGRSIA